MPRKRKPCKQFVPIGRALDQVIKSYARQSQQDLRLLWQCWEKVVGMGISRNTRPAALKGKRLIVNVASPTWLHQLQFMKKDLIAKLNLHVGKAMVEDIRFRIGSL